MKLGTVTQIAIVRQTEARLIRRRFGSHILGVVLANQSGARYVALADDVKPSRVAGALRHLLDAHAEPERVTLCRLPSCNAVLDWRPLGSDEALRAAEIRASSA